MFLTTGLCICLIHPLATEQDMRESVALLEQYAQQEQRAMTTEALAFAWPARKRCAGNLKTANNDDRVFRANAQD